MAYQYGVSVTDRDNVEVEFIHCRNMVQQAEWLDHLREKYPTAQHRVFPTFLRNGVWMDG